MREDIIAALKNALERGASIEQAMQSLINAGYNPVEVKQAAQYLSQGAMSITQSTNLPESYQQKPSQVSINQQSFQLPSQNQLAQPTRKEVQNLYTIKQSGKSPNKNLILIIVLLLILFLLIGALVYIIFFGEELLSSLFSK